MAVIKNFQANLFPLFANSFILLVIKCELEHVTINVQFVGGKRRGAPGSKHLFF